MRDFAAALLLGPRFGTARAAGPGRLALSAPWLLVATVMLFAAASGALHNLALPPLQDAAVAAAATIICLLLALPSACNGPGFWWILPLWLAPAIGVAGWALLPLPPGRVNDVLRGAALGLPVLRATLIIRAALPGMLLAGAMVFLLCWQWVGATSALPR